MNTYIVMVRDVSSGRIHRRFKMDGSSELASFESDNADDAGEVKVVDQIDLIDAPTEAFCKRCFPELHG